jgi:hypothetical protein
MFGLFNDEGCVEGDFSTEAEAVARLAQYEEDLGDSDHGLWVAEQCPDHPEHEKNSCELCEEE